MKHTRKTKRVPKALAMILSLVMLTVIAFPLAAFAEQADAPEAEVAEPTVAGEPVADTATEDLLQVADEAPAAGLLEAPTLDIAEVATHEVTFYGANGQQLHQQMVDEGNPLADPELNLVAPEGTEFAGWFEDGSDEPFQFEGSAITGKLDLHAVFEPLSAGTNPVEPTSPTEPTGSEGGNDDTTTPPAASEHTVTFMVEGQEYAALTVLDETLVVLPTEPSATESGPFVGWFREDGSPFNPYQVITEDVTLSAMFSEEAVLVTYLDTDGRVLEVLEGTIGEAAPAPTLTPTLTMGQALSHWAPVGSEEAFTGPLSESVTLAPVLTDVSMAVFVTNGSEIEPQADNDGFLADEPEKEPTRDGYTFAGWSSNEEGTDDFDFENTPINGTVFIYAKWDAAEANYTLNIWVEKVDVKEAGDPLNGGRGDYEIRYTTTQTGTTGEDISLTDTEAREAAKAAGTEVNKLLTYSTFAASEERTISPNGDTVLNVFFTRTPFTWNFSTAGQGTMQLANGTNVGSSYSVTAKLEETISGVWPAKVIFDKSGIYAVNWSGYYGFYPERVAYSYISVAFSAPTAMQKNFYYDVTTPRRHSVNLTATTTGNPYTETRVYYTELTDAERETYIATGELPGEVVRTRETNHATYGGLRYYKKAITADLAYQNGDPKTYAKGWPGRDIIGYETIGATTATTCTTANFQEIVPNGNRDYTLNYFMPSKSSTLTLVSGKGTAVGGSDKLAHGTDSYTATVPYGEALDSLLPTDMTLANHAFEGWYLDETHDTPYTAGATMPSNALTLYAKYRGTEVSVIYTDGAEVLTNTYSRGEKLNAHDLTGTAYAGANKGDVIPGKGTFMGWYYEVGDNQKATVQFPLGLALTRNEYVLKAELLPQTYTVTFLGDEGDSSPVTYDTQGVRSGADNTLARSGHTQLIPTREGYTFKGWSTTEGGAVSNFNTATRVLGNTSVYAIWEEIVVDNPNVDGPVDPEPVDPDPTTPKPTTPTTPGTKDTPTTTPITTETITPLVPALPVLPATQGEVLENPLTPAAQAQMDSQTGNVLADVLNDRTPLGGLNVTEGWSLLSLMMALVGAASGALVLAGRLFSRKGRKAAEDDEDGEENTARRRSWVFTGITAALGLLAGLLFLIFDNLSLPMVFVNQWTPLIALALVVHLVAVALHFTVRRRENDNDDQATTSI